ncbi:hypothetical protein NC652_037143 [Populus alba x Populus x berolinensis]|uniref:DUF7866 domain-containing protein n=1 Tax=Populus alba x Populus x berolinensis TaxID=444605 RepID=A0AAD6PVM7_9ROSI|nr:hypothetical protein NC652_037143 [Populus alba x Populus x berolinensis]KAJ6969246.1 hypothetical protein NC653_037037 [Populus alba x Populus x berolinensis]
MHACMYVHVQLLHASSLACQPTYMIEMNYSTKLAVSVLAILLLISGPAVEASPENTSLSSTAGEFRPMEAAEYRVIGRKGEDDLWRRRLAPFQLCLLCKCCAGAATTTCATMSCCFGIDCRLPNKPYGVCAFVPKTCNCTSCATV